MDRSGEAEGRERGYMTAEWARRPTPRWLVVFAVWSGITVLWSLSVGVGGSPDEPAHAVKAVAVADLQFDTDVRWSDGAFGSSVPRTEVHVPAYYQRAHQARTCWTGDTSVPASCMTEDASTEVVSTTTYVGTYPPIYYMAVGLPSKVLSPPGAFHAMRVVSALLTAAFLTEATMTVRRICRRRSSLVAAALAVPMSLLFLGSTVNPNGLEAAAALCLWASAVSVATSGVSTGTRHLTGAALSAVVLSWLRPLGPAYVLVILVLACATFATPETLRRLWSSVRARATTGAVAVSAAAAVVFALVNRSYGSLIEYEGMGKRSAAEAAREAVGDLATHLLRSWNLLGWQGADTFTVPAWITIPWLIVIGLLILTSLAVGTVRQRIGVAVLSIGCLVGPVIPSVVSRSTPWQGRYMLPLLVGIPLVTVVVLDRSSARLPTRVLERIAMPVVALWALAHLVVHQHLMNRTVVGLPARPLANLTSGIWRGPLTPTALFVWAVVASIAWVAVMLRLAGDETDEDRRRPTARQRTRSEDPAIGSS